MTNPIIEYYDNGNKFYEHYIVNGQFHRDPLEGPAVISYYDDGHKKFEKYLINGKLHRDPAIGPARIWYDKHSETERKIYYVNGIRHNPYGPAVIVLNDIYEWYLNDINYTNEVKEYLDKYNLTWQSMDHTDFDIMWTCIL